MGQDINPMIATLTKDSILNCSNCRKGFNLVTRTPIMVCTNQHNFCQECIEEISKAKKCYECKQTLLIKRKKNALLCYIIDKLNLNEDSSNKSEQMNANINQSTANSKMRRNQSSIITQFKTIQSPEKRAIKIKSVKQQSIPNLNLQLYQEERQFRKKYSVASVFSSTKMQQTDSPKKPEEETPEQALARVAQAHQIVPFKTILANKTDPATIKNLDLHLYKLPKIFSIFSHFKSLQRLNLTKNRISKIENLSQLKQLSYLSLSENQIEKIEHLEELTNLKNLYLNRNRIDKIQNLQTLTNLQFLGLAFNAIQKIENISLLTQLRWLNLQCNYITKIEGIITFKKLQIILLGSNQIAIFEGFDEFPSLQQVHIQNNKISNLSKALQMKHLRKIKLEDNPGLKEENSQSYMKLLEIIEAKSKGIVKSDEGCNIY